MPNPWLSLINLNISQLFQPSKTYQYDPLTKGNYIRYLVTRPGKGQDLLECNLHTTSLTELPYYEAVSYVWGSNKRIAQIYCAGRIIRITANLGDVLWRVRLPHSPRTLWVDSIAINQENQEEQGHQVALMGQIYRRADRTLICLGRDNGQGKDVASLLNDAKGIITTQLEEFGPWKNLPSLDKHNPFAQDYRWNFLSNIIFSPWCSRVWVVQEAAVARDAHILYGDTEFPWLDLLQVHHWILTKAPLLWRKHHSWLNDCYDQYFWKAKAVSPSTRHVELLARAKVLQFSDARDRVYAFLGSINAHVGPKDCLIVELNYAKDHSHLIVYHELAEQFLKHTNDLSLLSAVEHTTTTLKLKLSLLGTTMGPCCYQ